MTPPTGNKEHHVGKEARLQRAGKRSAAGRDGKPGGFDAKLHKFTPKTRLTWAIIAINVAVFVGMVATGSGVTTASIEGLLAWGANYGPRTAGGQFWRLLTSTFVHIGVVHLVMNMLSMVVIGSLMETLIGPDGFLVLYVFAGLCGSLASTAWNPFLVSAGASGAIFGLYGGLLAYVRRVGHQIPTEISEGLAEFALITVVYNAIYGFVHEGIDMSAHFGGLLGGFLMGLVLCHPPTAEAVKGRPRRALIGALGGALVLIVVARALPKTPDFFGALERVDEVNHQVVKAYDSAKRKWTAGELDDNGFADVIEKDVLPPWREAHTSVTNLEGLPAKQQAVVERLVRYASARTTAWQMCANGLRKNDAAMLEQGFEKLETSLEIMKEK